MSDRHLLRSGASRTASRIALARPEREKGLWNFLTWSFFLSQALAIQQFIGSAAHAAADGETSPASDQHGAVPTMDALPAASVVGHAIPAEDIAAADAAASGPDAGVVGEAAKSPIVTAALDGPGHGGSASDVGVPAMVEGDPASDHGTDLGPAASLAGTLVSNLHEGDQPAVLPGVLDPSIDLLPPGVGELLPPGVGDLLPPVTPGLEHLGGPLVTTVLDTVQPVVAAVEPIVDMLLPGVDALAQSVVTGIEPVAAALQTTLADTVQSASAAVEQIAAPLVAPVADTVQAVGSIVDPVATPLVSGITDVLASGGSVVLPLAPVTAPAGADPLVTTAGYTNLGLELNMPATNVVATDAAGAGLDPTSDAHHDVQVANVSLPSALEDLHLRGLGDGIV